MTTTLGPYTVKEWLATPVGEHWQLIGGNLIITEESYGNSRLAKEIELEIGFYLRQQPLGTIERNVAFRFPEIANADREGVVPDLCYIPSDELKKANLKANVQEGVVPALVIEILSPSTEKIDLGPKVAIYREARVQEYWILDWEEETVLIYRFAEAGEKPVAVKSFDDTLTTPLLPGFSLELPKMREALDAIRRQG